MFNAQHFEYFFSMQVKEVVKYINSPKTQKRIERTFNAEIKKMLKADKDITILVPPNLKEEKQLSVIKLWQEAGFDVQEGNSPKSGLSVLIIKKKS